MNEKQIEKRLITGIRTFGGLCLKFESPGLAGVPDRIVILPRGLIYFVELKTDTGRLSPMQRKVNNLLHALGVKVRVLYGADEVDEFLEEVGGWSSRRISTKATQSSV